MLRYHSAFWRGLHRTRNADTSRQSGAFWQLSSPAASTHPPLSPQAQPQPSISADPGWREPGIQLLFPRERNPLLVRWRRGGGGRWALEGALPRRAGLWAPAAPGGASRTLEGRAAPPPGLFVLPRSSCGPAPTSTRLEWQEISQRFPPTRSPGQSAAARAVPGAAHTHVPEPTPPYEQPLSSPRPLPPARPALPAARARLLGPSLQVWARTLLSGPVSARSPK